MTHTSCFHPVTGYVLGCGNHGTSYEHSSQSVSAVAVSREPVSNDCDNGIEARPILCSCQCKRWVVSHTRSHASVNNLEHA